jgi:hypothetical protein
MKPTLAWSCEDRALAIRDHLLPLIRERGTLQEQQGAIRLIRLRLEPWLFNHWTPFKTVLRSEAASPGYRHALEHQHAGPDLPYGLEVWHGERMLSVMWADGGACQVCAFVRGPWEETALALPR